MAYTSPATRPASGETHRQPNTNVPATAATLASPMTGGHARIATHRHNRGKEVVESGCQRDPDGARHARKRTTQPQRVFGQPQRLRLVVLELDQVQTPESQEQRDQDDADSGDPEPARGGPAGRDAPRRVLAQAVVVGAGGAGWGVGVSRCVGVRGQP